MFGPNIISKQETFLHNFLKKTEADVSVILRKKEKRWFLCINQKVGSHNNIYNNFYTKDVTNKVYTKYS